MAVIQNVEWYRGEDVTLTVTLAPVIDITGWAITFTVRANGGDSYPALITKTVGAGITLTTPASGIFTVIVEDSDTTGLQPGAYVYDIKRTDAGAEAILTIGRLSLKQEVTR